MFAAGPDSPISVNGSLLDSVATGVFTSSGNTDLLVAGFGSNTVSVYFGDGQGDFTLGGTYATGSGPNGFAVAPDGSYFALGNYNDGTVSVFHNQGDGTFVLSQTLTADAGPANRMALVDLTGNGILDLVTANEKANDVTVFMGNGDGTFQTGHDYAAGNGPVAVVAGDFTGNGHVSLVTANYNDSTITLLPGNGDGTFGAPEVVGSAPGNPFDMVTADFNGDGKPDLAVASLYGNVTVFMGNGDGTFQPGVGYYAGNNPTQLTVGDFTGTGIPDIAVSNFGNTVGILLGNGDGTFQPVVSIAASGDLNGIIAGRFTSSGKTDLAVVGQDGATLQVLLNRTLQAKAGQAFTGTIASFTDGNPLATTGDFTATINWGDGQTTQVGSDAFVANSQGGFDLVPSHVYQAAGTYSISITVTDDGGSSITINSTSYVSV
jgi:hypothetical protein